MPTTPPSVTLATASVLRLDADVLILPVLESDGKAAADATMTDVDRALGGHLHRAAAADGFKGRADQPATVRAATEGALLGAYRFDRYRTNGADERGTLGGLQVALPPGVRRT